MLIELTRRNPGGAGTPLVINADLIVSVEPVGEAGSTIEMQGGRRYDVLELYDQILDHHADSHDADHRQKAAAQRRKDRAEREEIRKKLLADNEAAKARDEASKAQAESEKVAREALRKAALAKQAAASAGLPYNENVTPEGIDEKHPAPQPHRSAPVGTAPPVPAEAPKEDRGAGGAFKHQHGKK